METFVGARHHFTGTDGVAVGERVRPPLPPPGYRAERRFLLGVEGCVLFEAKLQGGAASAGNSLRLGALGVFELHQADTDAVKHVEFGNFVGGNQYFFQCSVQPG